MVHNDMFDSNPFIHTGCTIIRSGGEVICICTCTSLTIPLNLLRCYSSLFPEDLFRHKSALSSASLKVVTNSLVHSTGSVELSAPDTKTRNSPAKVTFDGCNPMPRHYRVQAARIHWQITIFFTPVRFGCYTAGESCSSRFQTIRAVGGPRSIIFRRIGAIS